MSDKILKSLFTKIEESRLVNVCLNLIRTPAETGEETARAAYIKELMKETDLEVITQIVEPERGSNVRGIKRGEGGGKNLMLHAHTDGFPCTREQEKAGLDTGMVRDRKIFGSGIGDQIGCIAAFYGVLDILNRSGVRLKGNLLWAQPIDEEMYMSGSWALADVDAFGADMILIGEPTDFNIGVAHTGLVEMEIETRGYAGHPSHIGLGFKYANAVVSMHKIINILIEMQKVEPIFNVRHPRLGQGAVFYLGPIIGGSRGMGDPSRPVGPGRGRMGNAYLCPEWCRLRIGVRTLPGQKTDEVTGVIRKHLKSAQQDDPSIEADLRVYLDRNYPVEIPEDSPAVSVLRRSIVKVLGKEPGLIGNVYCTDLPPFFNLKRKISGAWTGPGLGRYLRTDEHISIEELVNTVKIFTAAVIDVCEAIS